MTIDPVTGLLCEAVLKESPNADERPAACVEELIVIHNISLPPGEFGGGDIARFFLNCLDNSKHPFYKEIQDLKVSAHLLIDRQGQVIQFVPFNRRAWHAGQSEYLGRQRCNDFSIGIELEGTDESPYEPVQYEKLLAVVNALFGAYPTLSAEHIVGHCEIAPGRKTDPGPSFDWQYFRDCLKKSG